MTWQTEIESVIKVEGGYSDDPSDSGGATMYGITERVARAYGYGGPMRDMPRSTAFDILKGMYWDPIGGDLILPLSQPVAHELLDSAVNIGVGRVSPWFQRCLNVLNDGAKWYADIPGDGRIGKLTVAAFADYLKRRGADGETVMLRALNSLQGEHYISLAEARPKDERFVFGWFLNRVG